MPAGGLINAAYERIKSDILSKNFVPRKLHPKGKRFEPGVNTEKAYLKNVTIEEYQLNDTGRSNEAYSVEISEDGETLVKSVSYRGSLWALRSLQQLFYAHSEPNTDPYTPCAPVSI